MAGSTLVNAIRLAAKVSFNAKDQRLSWHSQFWFWMVGEDSKVLTRTSIVFAGYIPASVNVICDNIVASISAFIKLMEAYGCSDSASRKDETLPIPFVVTQTAALQTMLLYARCVCLGFFLNVVWEDGMV